MDYQQLDFKKVKTLAKLSDLSNPPKKLYCLGKLDPKIFEHCVAVVGSRRMTSYGERVIEKIIPQLVSQNKTVVSGFIYGVDQYAHQVAVESGGKTIAVLGWGIKQKLSGQDLNLAKKIISTGGLLISEWEEQKGALWTFPSRNRIVAALCGEVIIVEAAQNSGSLITGRLAIKLKRKLWAVPGPITSKTSVGTNGLIASGKAQMWLGEVTQEKLNFNDPILNALENESLTADEMARKLNLPIEDVGSQLSLMLLSGQVAEKAGKYYLNDVS